MLRWSYWILIRTTLVILNFLHIHVSSFTPLDFVLMIAKKRGAGEIKLYTHLPNQSIFLDVLKTTHLVHTTIWRVHLSPRSSFPTWNMNYRMEMSSCSTQVSPSLLSSWSHKLSLKDSRLVPWRPSLQNCKPAKEAWFAWKSSLFNLGPPDFQTQTYDFSRTPRVQIISAGTLCHSLSAEYELSNET